MLRLISKKETPSIERGDIIVTKEDYYLVVKASEEYELISLTTDSVVGVVVDEEDVLEFITDTLEETIIQVIKSLSYIIQEC